MRSHERICRRVSFGQRRRRRGMPGRRGACRRSRRCRRGTERKTAAGSCGTDWQRLRDRVHRHNAEGLKGLSGRRPVGPARMVRLAALVLRRSRNNPHRRAVFRSAPRALARFPATAAPVVEGQGSCCLRRKAGIPLKRCIFSVANLAGCLNRRVCPGRRIAESGWPQLPCSKKSFSTVEQAALRC